MKHLLLLRHAKAVASSPAGDFERELSARGRHDASLIGTYLADAGLRPDLILASPSRRTRETADLVAQALADPPEVIWRRELYLAEPHAILDLVRETEPEVASLLVIGHNPGIADLASLMAVAGDPQAREALQASFPTAALAALDLPGEVWQGASFYDGTLTGYVTPRQLR